MKYLVYSLVMCFSIIGCSSGPKDGKEFIYRSDGSPDLMYTYENGVLNGEYLNFYPNGDTMVRGEYQNGDLQGECYTFTPEGDTAVIERYKKGMLKYRRVFYQEMPDDNTFKKVSDKGFVTVKKGFFIELDSTTPDNIIEEKIDPETGASTLFIWKDGKSRKVEL